MSKQELAEALARDYATRAAQLDNDYKEAYTNYYNRCLKRREQDLLQQFNVQGLT